MVTVGGEEVLTSLTAGFLGANQTKALISALICHRGIGLCAPRRHVGKERRNGLYIGEPHERFFLTSRRF